MAVIGNIVTAIGDVLIIEVAPLIGVGAITGYSDITVGETPTRLFKREFRYAPDSINYTVWAELTAPNVSAMVVSPSVPLMIQYRYTRIGTDPTGQLEFVSVTLSGIFVAIQCSDLYNNSVFAQFFDCTSIEHIEWCVAMLEKLYKLGIVPKHIIRNENSNANGEDDDYLAFFRTVSCFFSLIVSYARQFEAFATIPVLLRKYLEEKDMFFCSDAEMSDMLYIMSNYYSEIRQRGTMQIYERKGNLAAKPVHGELLRTICFNEAEDEFLFTITKPEHTGWTIDRSSPLYRGTYFDDMLIKAYSKSQNFDDLSEYPLINPLYIGNASIPSPPSGVAGEVMHIGAVPINDVAGIGDVVYNADAAIIVDPHMDYEFTFWVQTKIYTGGKLAFAMKGYDKDNQLQPMVSAVTGATLIIPAFFGNWQPPTDNTWYFVRAIVYSKYRDNMTAQEATLDIQQGQHMRFHNDPLLPDVNQLIPYLVQTNYGGAAPTSYMRFWDFKVRPLNKPYGTGFVSSKNLIQVWAKNNNNRFVTEETALTNSEHPITNDKLVKIPELEEFVRNKLVPYNSSLVINWLNNE